MPPRARAKPASALAGLVGSDSEPDLDAFDEAEIQAARTMSVTKKPRGRPPRTANKVTKTTASSTRRGSGMLSAVPESATRPSTTTKTNSGMAGAGRKAQQDVQDETVTFDDIEALPSVMSTVTKKGTRGRPRSVPPSASKNANNDTSVLVPPSAAKRRGRPPRQAVKPPEEIPETQQEDAMELDVVVEEEEGDINGDVAPVAEPLESWAGYDGSEVSLRRRLGELSKKYENLDMRHRDLREVGVKEAERNFERLKKQAEERTAAANQLIAELKAELAAQTALAKEGEQLRQQLEESEAKAEDLEATIEELTGSLSEAKSEIKTLSTKLAAVRSGDVNSRVPGSAMKAGGLASRTAQAEAAHATQATAQAKEDLYADLTDLIIRGVRQEEMEDVFDCIQTGRNGSLHFKLAVETAEASDSYEDTQFTYRPQLDSNRDGELMDILPDYLVEEITFPRPQASRFYARVVKSLTERIE
ncbi:hypothetical protein FSOLCH5_012009 [Fusarium solani]|uniref:Chromosome segregation protein Csm1/Pcs1-domain-containing protein n=1 Tax=Fusarium solani TaxID=169388 RepID=A0A9P9GT22_FUSSL|nr:chromosome segregation protein Csm1/Pcs1-domain-containing protein [Fusarium solani]KAH7244611.1 chromosome segregation protein Csm1/Pcs1-domain-containing protein [Fusarium solani]KAJ3457438.1 hypothetical protein MRS44_014579 [Fusarium solani]KAJ4228822.1 hypothetical protein NW759_003546 [Fusarium solani]